MKLASASSTGCRRVAIVCALALLCLQLGLRSGTASAATFTRGFADDVWFDFPADGISQPRWITKTATTGAKLVQIEVDWVGLEPNAPSPSDPPGSPSGPQFSFTSLDHEVDSFRGRGLQPVFLITDAPRWAEGAGGTASEYAAGSYEPSPAALGLFAEALAKRYSGSYPDPDHQGWRLPRVRYFQAWAEANMNLHLSPQWTRIDGQLVNTGPTIYRGMLNAFYAGLKTGNPSAQVISSGLEAYGDPPDSGQHRTPPVTFLENLFCLSSQLKATSCPEPAHLDILASDPYDVGAPTLHALSPADASAPDLGRLYRVMDAALQLHTLLPGGQKPLWVTEFGYESNPPNPYGTLSLAKQARWLEQSFYVFWREGVSTVLWYLVRDQPPPYVLSYASGVYLRNGKQKPSYTAYRFPLVVTRNGSQPQVWGIAPVSGTVHFQVKRAGTWQNVSTFHSKGGAVFDFFDASLRHGTYRATVRGQHSLAWSY